MSQYDELKRLADRALNDRRFCGDENHKALADGVLAMIAENERLNAENKQLVLLECQGGTAQAAVNLLEERDQLRAEVAGLKTGYEAYERVNAEQKQKVTNLEVCQTASLGMSGIIKCVAGELGFDASGEDSAQDYLIGLARQANGLKAECEALRSNAELVSMGRAKLAGAMSRLRAKHNDWSLPDKLPDADLVWCGCGDGYPQNSYGAGFMDANSGVCANCDAAMGHGERS